MQSPSDGEALPSLQSELPLSLNNPHLAGSLPGGLPGDLDACLADTFSILDDWVDIYLPARQPVSHLRLATCKFESWAWLCWRRDPGHLLVRGHSRRVFDFLQAREVRRAFLLAKKYGMVAVNDVALVVEVLERQGVEWREGLDLPGAFLHYLIRDRAAVVQEGNN